MKKFSYPFWLASGLILGSLTIANLTQAQIVPDRTLPNPTKVSSDNQTFTIRGGSQSQDGKNLFHSFKEFSVPTNGRVIFDNHKTVQNIFSRVTGRTVSNIDGLIEISGNANLFLINPSGIIFGRHAQLNINGSFVASTADRINFSDGSFFSATDVQTPPLLNVSIPVGLQFRETPGSIVNQSIVINDPTLPIEQQYPVGLQVKSGKTLALVGGDVILEGGALTAPSGRIEVASVAGSSVVNLIPITGGWTLDYNNVQNFQDIQLSNAAVIDTSGEASGTILLRGRKIGIAEGTEITALNLGTELGGSIFLKASESIEVINSKITSVAFSTGKAGDMTFVAPKLLVFGDSPINASTQGEGRGGDITVIASKLVEINGNGEFSTLATLAQVGSTGNAGNLQITTPSLILRDGGQLSSTTRSRGKGGTINIQASESIEISGQGGIINDRVILSGILARSMGKEATGNGGTININTNHLLIKDNSIITVAADEGSRGQAGDLKVNANDLTLQNKAKLSAATIFSQEGNNEGANIRLRVTNTLELRNASEISATSTGTANGGNITIDSRFLLAYPPEGLNGSDITANSMDGAGGKIEINAKGVFGTQIRDNLTRNNDITAFSQLNPNLNGIINFNTPDIDPSRGLVQFSTVVINPNTLIAQNACIQQDESQLVITGRGGLPPSIIENISDRAIEIELIPPVDTRETQPQKPTQNPKSTTQTSIIPARGWVYNNKKEVVLIAYDPTAKSFQRRQENDNVCPVPY